ncbi:glycoside hydrolase family 2 TIM barrel-domain containing protein [Echinicola strongylocentroti]|nr:glycoside hydrolase family 2 TIM barrel-domain containing protein [Echinicola strongylocentroti]
MEDNPAYSSDVFLEEEGKNINIPHDWAFNNGISKTGSQTDKGGYYSGGVAWYQRLFETPEDLGDQYLYLEFDGVYRNSEVWVNGHYLGKRPYGYISFRYEISDYLHEGENLIAVRVDNSEEPSARWYHPCGIYAPVRLITKSPDHILPLGVFSTSSFSGSGEATVNTEVTIGLQEKNTSQMTLETVLLNKNGEVEGRKEQIITKEGKDTVSYVSDIQVPSPVLWEPDSPYLYTLVTRLKSQNDVLDEVKTQIGIREVEWTSKEGFFLNGQQTKLRGVCEHWEGGPVGGAWTKPLMRWKLGLLKEMGVNAIRTAHNPYPPFFYDLCDEMGLMVMDEVFDGWKKKAPFDYGSQDFVEWWERDLTEWIKRDRNHPSVIIWSVGNETNGPVGADIVAQCHALDSTRLVTSGHSGSQFMDVHGVNGHSEKMSFYDEDHPDKAFIATEAPHTWQTRGYYRTQSWFRDGYPNDRQTPFPLPDLTEEEIFHYEWAAPSQWANHKQHFNSSYDNATVRISARKNWELMRDLPWYSGHFRWTGFDYYGEAGYVHGGWPFRLFMSGALDVAGFKKDLFYFYQSQWTEEPMVHIFPHWTHPTMTEGTKIPVWVYSNADEVELFLNGQSLGKDKPGSQWDEMQCEWMVPYASGRLTAKAYIDGQVVAQQEYHTAGAPVLIAVEVEDNYLDAAKDRTAIVTALIQDEEGAFYPYGENTLYYHLGGDARLLSLENGDPVDTTKTYDVASKKAFMGLSNAFWAWEDGDGSGQELTIGAILGEKQLLTSAEAAIDVKTISLDGNAVDKDLRVFYTTDGTSPDTGSMKYTQPFKVSLGMTVKAIVVEGNTTILEMEETFGQDLGLYWGDGKEADNEALQGMPAVDAEYTGAVPRNAAGNAYLDFRGKEGTVTWYQENDGSAGMFDFEFYYASGDKNSNRPMDLYINGQKVTTMIFKNSGSWNSGWKKIQKAYPLKAGANEIELRTTGQSGPNILMLDVR